MTVSRGAFLSTGATLLAGFTADAVLPAAPSAPSAAAAGSGVARAGTSDLALYRPVTVSCTDYAPTPARFAVDLQAPCEIEAVTLVFEAAPADPPFDADYNDTTGDEILAGAATSFTLDVSADGETWQSVHQTASGPGGEVDIPLSEPVTAQYVRMTSTAPSNTNPVGLNGFQVYGTCATRRPQATGWAGWAAAPRPAPALAVAADGTVPLDSGWSVTLDDFAPGGATGASLSSAEDSIVGGSWVPATVPGTVQADFVAQGLLPPDPVGGFDKLNVPEALSRHGWWYRRPFTLPRGLDTAGGRHVWLEFDGVNREAVAWVDGTNVGTLPHPFARARFDITSALAGGAAAEHALAVWISPMPHPGTPGDKSSNGSTFVNSDELHLDSPTCLAASGRDWTPAVRDRAAGIWNHVRLRSTGDAVIGDPHVTTTLPNLPDTSVAQVTIAVPVSNAGTVTRTIAVTAAFDDVTVSGSVSVAAGQSATLTFAPADHPQLTVRRPRLWWPNGYGEPALHDLEVTASVGGAASDRRGHRFGIREFGYSYDEPVVISRPGKSPLDFTDDRAPQAVDFVRQRARYVRIQCGTRATQCGDSIWTLSVFDTAGSSPTADLALNRTATASSEDDSSHGAGNAVDGAPNTRWSSAYEDDQWIQVDLGSARTFDQVVIVWERAYATNYTIQVSNDGSTWTDVLDVDNTVTQLTISCNGVKVFCRGGNWGWDEQLRRVPPDRMTQTVAMHRDMNFTMIRNWIGGGNREELYAACDENGILVWNDFWDGGTFPDDRPGYVAMATDTILRYRVHPCIAVWGGANEAPPPPDLNAGLANAVATENPEVYYQDDSAGAPVSGHGPYSWIDPANYYDASTYDSNAFGFHTEIGIPVVPVLESMQQLVGDQRQLLPSEVWNHHDWSPIGNQRVDAYQTAISDRLGASNSLADFCTKAQFVNYESMRAIFEAWTANLWRNTSAVLLWMSHPAWHSTVWQTYDYDLDVNGAYYGARKGCEPLHIQANPTTWQTLAANHTPEPVTGATITASVYGLDGTLLSRAEQLGLNIAAANTAPGFTVAWPPSLPDLHLVRLQLTDAHGTLLSQNTYWRYADAADMTALNSLGQTRLAVRLSGGGETDLTATITNKGPVVAAMVRLSLLDEHGARILPTQYGDNYLWLLPGESREVAVSRPGGSAFGGRPQLVAEAYNSAAVSAG
jgi:F5/8 type C domain/Exo-beta-D-glucosaminidase Ig-fold domain/Glycosyl hydrolases family 2